VIFPLNFWDISLWLAIAAIILLITSEMFSPHYSKINVQINRKRLRNVAMVVSILFLVAVAISLINRVLTP